MREPTNDPKEEAIQTGGPMSMREHVATAVAASQMLGVLDKASSLIEQACSAIVTALDEQAAAPAAQTRPICYLSSKQLRDVATGRRGRPVMGSLAFSTQLEGNFDTPVRMGKAVPACIGPEWTVPAPHPVLAAASFCIAVTGEGAIARVVHGGWYQLLTAFAAELWTDGKPENDPDQWAEWLQRLQDTDEWLHDEGNQPSSFSAELCETAQVSMYRLAGGAA